jgi:predicted PolB exonuclease-like 3'-5' exonuclease
MRLSGKLAGIHGGEVARYYLEVKIKEVADYCETDIVNTYRVWLRYELFRGRLTNAVFAASEANLIEFIKLRGNTKPHLIDLTQ